MHLGKQGNDVQRLIKTRVNQSLFRKVIVSNYSNACAICGLDVENLLIASHIIKWSENKDQRLNPENGLCLCNIHDKAFESGLLTITPDFKIKISSVLKKQNKIQNIQEYFLRYDNQPMIMPNRFLPDVEFLKYHNQERFKH